MLTGRHGVRSQRLCCIAQQALPSPTQTELCTQSSQQAACSQPQPQLSTLGQQQLLRLLAAAGTQQQGAQLAWPPDHVLAAARAACAPQAAAGAQQQAGQQQQAPTSRMSLSMDLGTPMMEQVTPCSSHSFWMALAAALPPLPPTTNTMSRPQRSMRFTISFTLAPPREVPCRRGGWAGEG